MFAGDIYKLLEGTADAAFVVTLGGEICFWNNAAVRLFGYEAEDVLTKRCHEVLQGKDALGAAVCTGEYSIHQGAAHDLPMPAFDLEVTTHSRQRIWVRISTIIFDDSRLRHRLIAHLAHDITTHKQVEQAFAKMVELSKQLLSLGDGGSRPAPVEPLSEQEKRILKLFANSKNSTQVARDLGITLPTLRNHLHAINQKLRTHNRLEAVLHAMKRGLI